MIAVTRPDGDELAKGFNGFLSRTEVRKLEVGDKFPIMCENGDHYLVQIKSIAHGVAKVHFVGMTNDHFYEGPLQNLYITDEPRHLTRRIQKKQIYHKEYTTIRKTKQEEAAPPVKKLSAFHANTRYSDEFLSKPYKTDHRKRRNPGDTATPPPSPTTTRSKHSDFTTSRNAEHSTRPGSISIAFKRNTPAVAVVVPGHNRTSNNTIATKSNLPAVPDLSARPTRSTMGSTLPEAKERENSHRSISNSNNSSNEGDMLQDASKTTSTGRSTRNNPIQSTQLALLSTSPKEGVMESPNNTRAASAAATKEPVSSDRATRSKRTYDIHSELRALDNVPAESAQSKSSTNTKNNHITEQEKDIKDKHVRTNSSDDTELEIPEVPPNKRRRANSTASEKSITAVDNIANISASVAHDNKHLTAGTAIGNSVSLESHSSTTDVIPAPTLNIDSTTKPAKHHKGRDKTTAKVRPPIDYSIATPANGYPELQPGEIILSSRLSGCGKLRATYTKRNKMTYLSYIDVPPASTDSGVPFTDKASSRHKANDTFLITSGCNDADSYAEKDIVCLMNNTRESCDLSIDYDDQIRVSIEETAGGTATTTVATAAAATTTTTTASTTATAVTTTATAPSTASSSSTSICADASLPTLRVVPTIHVSSMKYVHFHPVHINDHTMEGMTSKDKSTTETNMDTAAKRSTINNQSTSTSLFNSSVNTILAELHSLSKLPEAELKRRRIDPQAFTTLLSSQTKLAKVTQEMLEWEK